MKSSQREFAMHRRTDYAGFDPAPRGTAGVTSGSSLFESTTALEQRIPLEVDLPFAFPLDPFTGTFVSESDW